MDHLHDKLRKYVSEDITPMHMPGHKRNPEMIDPCFSKDITEIRGFDNLHDPHGVIKDLEEAAASIWNASGALLSVNGATAPILSAMMAASSRGKILIASNCHISVWHALELSGVDFKIIDPDTDPGFPFCLETDPIKLDSILNDDPDIRTVVITSPTYEGIISDIESLARVAHSHNAALIVDEAHGAHLGLNEYFPASSVADVVIKSIHKTLHAPTQTAVLLTYSDRIKLSVLKHYMDIFVSSSPSYILMDGISSAIYSVKDDPLITKPWADALRNCRDILKKELQHLKMFDRKGIDPSKLVIISGGVINGNSLSDMLRSEKIEIEASFDTHIIAMTGIGDTYSSLERFTSALIKIDRSLTGKIDEAFDPAIPGSGLEMSLNISKAVTLPRESVPVRDSIGRVSSSYVFKYPPGIPILIPGQKITADRADLCGKEELEVLSNPFN